MLINCFCNDGSSIQNGITRSLFLVILGVCFLISLIKCRNDNWPKTHRRIYILMSIGLLQFPLVITPLLSFFGSWSKPWIIGYAISFCLFLPGFVKWLNISLNHGVEDEEIDNEIDSEQL